MQNSVPMKEWHAEHMEKTLAKYVTGLSPTASAWEKRNHKKYARMQNICRQIDYDIKHGVTSNQVLYFLDKIRADPSFLSIRQVAGSIERLREIENYYRGPASLLR
jgi:hypothetical protein